jgi:MFS transporter, DHA2 family, multidrug resistance protein
MKRFDTRLIMSTGLFLAASSMWMMAGWTPDVEATPVLLAGFLQGLGLGAVFAPMNITAFSTISPMNRPDGTSLLGLTRSVGGSIGISVLVNQLSGNLQVSHADLAGSLSDPAVGEAVAVTAGGSYAGIHLTILALLDSEVNRQAAMIAHLNIFYALFWILLFMAFLPFLLPKPVDLPVGSGEMIME